MKVLTIILGILLTIAGVICLFYPGETFLETGYIIAIMLLVYGVVGSIGVIAKKLRPSFLWTTIPAIIIGVVALFLPGDKLFMHALLIYLLAAWFIIQGISSIYMSVRSRFFYRSWPLSLVIGIISVALGVYTALQPALGVLAIGILVGIFLIEAGIDLMVIGATVGRVEGIAKEAADIVDEAREEMNKAYENAKKTAGAPADSAATEAVDEGEKDS